MLVAVPAPVVTLIVPDVVPAGTVAVIWLSATKTNAADVPLKLTSVTAEPPRPSENPDPFMVTIVPTGPQDGLKSVIVCPKPFWLKANNNIKTTVEVIVFM